MGERFDFICTPPGFDVPAGACDTHMHVFGPAETYPYSGSRGYTPPDATLADYQAVAAKMGIERTVFVQPSSYAEDNRCMLDAMKGMGAPARGIVGIKPDVAEAELAAMRELGVRGVRINMNHAGESGADGLIAMMTPIAERIRPYGWHIQGFLPADALPAVPPVIDSLPVDLVIDHMGMFRASSFESHPGWPAMKALLGTGKVWVKLSGAYRVNDGVDGKYGMVPPLAQALIDLAPERMVWGSDWPHTPPHPKGDARFGVTPFRRLDPGQLLALLADWAPDPALRKRILVDNPARLYDYP